ncbi:MAG: hypothetical protein HS116_13725 [Planctomycetes bacterium]|nr:hypothetical protein [Planctomycetota bacterium]
MQRLSQERPSSRRLPSPHRPMRGSRMLQNHCPHCSGVLRAFGDTGKWACERCQQVVTLGRAKRRL